MDEDSKPQDAPVEPTQEPTTQAVAEPPAEQDVQDAPVETGEQSQPEQVVETPTIEDDDDYGYPDYNLPPQTGIDFSNLPTGEDGYIDPNALAGSINQQIQLAEERASMRAQQAFQEQQAETKAWDKAFEKYPDLKGNRDLRDMIQNTRMGEITAALNRGNVNPQDIKLKTPMQVADSFFKHIGSAKAEGMKQATTNTVVQQSAYTETASRRGSDSADAATKAFQNINNPNKEVANKARTELLQRKLGWLE